MSSFAVELSSNRPGVDPAGMSAHQYEQAIVAYSHRQEEPTMTTNRHVDALVALVDAALNPTPGVGPDSDVAAELVAVSATWDGDILTPAAA